MAARDEKVKTEVDRERKVQCCLQYISALVFFFTGSWRHSSKGLSDNGYCQLQTINLQEALIWCKAILNIQVSEHFIPCVAIS